MEPKDHYRIQLSVFWASLIQISYNTDYLFLRINLVRFCAISVEMEEMILLLNDCFTK